MNKLDMLYDIAAEENICLYFADSIPGYDSDALYIAKEGLKIITIVGSIKDDLIRFTEILAEELGHHFTTTGNNINANDYLERVNIDKCERKAMRWAYAHLVSFQDLVDAFVNGCRTYHEISEFIGVSDKFLLDAIDFYAAKYGTKVISLGEYSISFVPNFIIYKQF